MDLNLRTSISKEPRMSKARLLLDVSRDMRTLADSLQALAYEGEPYSRETTALPATSHPTISDVRAVLGKKVTAEVKALLAKFGVNKLSELDVGRYNQLLVEAEELPDA